MLGQEIVAAQATYPVLAEKDDACPAIRLEERRCPCNRLDPAARLLATCTMADGANDWLAGGVQSDTSAHTSCNCSLKSVHGDSHSSMKLDWTVQFDLSMFAAYLGC